MLPCYVTVAIRDSALGSLPLKMDEPNLKARKRSDYVYFLAYPTRWSVSSSLKSVTKHKADKITLICLHRSDNDQYSHINNSIYYHLFDSIVNTYLIEKCGLDPKSSPQIGLVVSSYCEVWFISIKKVSSKDCCHYHSSSPRYHFLKSWSLDCV